SAGGRGLLGRGGFRGFDFVGVARRLRGAIPALPHLVVAGDPVDGELNLERGLAESPPFPANARTPIGSDQVFRMAFTSGTTGNPKCVLHSPNTTLPAVRQINRDMQVTEGEGQLVYLPVCLNWGYLCLL